jgi:hypothetical protein
MNRPEYAAAGAAITRRDVLHGLAAAAAAAATAGVPAAVAGEPPPPRPLRKLRLIETAWVPMSDGVRLAARIWLPADAEADKVPAIVEYIPYGRRNTRDADDPRAKYWAARGYAYVRPDIRGSGDSDGILADEYTKQEQDDGVELIHWLARQPWCTGAVGMVGISWGGFSALQVAARQPPELKAIITHCSTDDRYADDAHYIGGQERRLRGPASRPRSSSVPDQLGDTSYSHPVDKGLGGKAVPHRVANDACQVRQFPAEDAEAAPHAVASQAASTVSTGKLRACF